MATKKQAAARAKFAKQARAKGATKVGRPRQERRRATQEALTCPRGIRGRARSGRAPTPER